MQSDNLIKIKTTDKNLFLRVEKGHFASNRLHSNYYIDVAAQKSRLSEAKAVANKLCENNKYATTIIDSILCLDGTEVVGTCIADKLVKHDFININSHQTIYIVTPETNSGQILFRDNIIPMIKGKHVLVLAVSVASGTTVQTALDAIQYYGGEPVGVAAMFSTKEEIAGFKINSVFNPSNLEGYFSVPAHECPLCKEGKKLDAIINHYGYSKL